jgi:hypothetical protein
MRNAAHGLGLFQHLLPSRDDQDLAGKIKNYFGEKKILPFLLFALGSCSPINLKPTKYDLGSWIKVKNISCTFKLTKGAKYGGFLSNNMCLDWKYGRDLIGFEMVYDVMK